MPSLCQKHGVLINGGVCSHYGVFMHVLHAPCLIGAVLDILAKRHALRERALSAATMGILAEGRTLSAALSAKLPMFSPRELLLYLTAYHIFFQSWCVSCWAAPSHVPPRAHTNHSIHIRYPCGHTHTYAHTNNR